MPTTLNDDSHREGFESEFEVSSAGTWLQFNFKHAELFEAGLVFEGLAGFRVEDELAFDGLAVDSERVVRQHVVEGLFVLELGGEASADDVV